MVSPSMARLSPNAQWQPLWNALFRRFGFLPNGGFALRDSKGPYEVHHQVRYGSGPMKFECPMVVSTMRIWLSL